MRLYFTIFIFLFLAACDDKLPGSNANSVVAGKNNGNSANTTAKTNEHVPVYTYEIVNTFRHDSDAFTQGLIFNNGFLYESTGHEEIQPSEKLIYKTVKFCKSTN